MKTRNAETPKSASAKKTPPPKKAPTADAGEKTSDAAAAAATKTAIKSGARAAKKATPKAPSPATELNGEETVAPVQEKKPVSAAKKTAAKGKSPVSGKASAAAATKSEETKVVEPKVEDTAPEVEADESNDAAKIEVASDVRDVPEADPIKNEEENPEEVEPMEEDAEQDDVEEDGDVEEEGGAGVEEEEGAGEEGVEGEEVEHEEEGAHVEEEEQIQITGMAEARKMKKEKEIFVGGLDRDAGEDDLKKVFEKVGEVVEVRLHRDFVTNKNKGFAFVKFANKEQAIKALTQMKNPMIRGKRCGIAPSEDNDTLFLGNICNTWTKEAIKRKLKDYSIDNVESITLVEDTQNEGLSRGFAFLEFSCHADAMLAYKRLQKPDVIFGHFERTAKVAFAEPIREPDPEVMAQVKSVFVDGLPPYWDEDRVKEQFKGYGEIERVVLARNMPTAKRKDFGFVNFTTHEAAVTCVDGVNNSELGDGKSKVKARARLANPLPKTQAVKGGMSGGFRIGYSGIGVYSRFGRGFARGRFFPNRAGFRGGRGFNLRGRGRGGRFPFPADNIEISHSGFRGRRPFGFRGGSAPAAARAGAFVRGRGSAFVRGRGRAFPPRRQSFVPEEEYEEPFNAGQDPYFYGGNGHGVKRPFSMVEHGYGYVEPASRMRPRYDQPDPLPGRYRGSLGMSGLYSDDYYGSEYGGSSYSSTYGIEHTGGGYYY